MRVLTASTTARTHPRYAVVQQMLYHGVGSFSYFLCEFENSARAMEVSVAAARRMGDKSATGESLTTLGTVMAWQGKSAIAHVQLNEAAALFIEMDDSNGLADVQHELARMANYEGNYAKGKELATQSLASSERIRRPDWIAYALMERGVSSFYLGEYDNCRLELERSLVMFQEIGHPVGMAYALGEMAWLNWATGGAHSAEAEAQARQSLEIARKVGHQLQIPCRLAQLAQFANDRGDHVEAIRFAQEGLTLAAALNTPHFLSQNLCMLAESAYRQRDFAQARRHLAQACHAAASAGLQGRVLLALYHAAILLQLEAESRGEVAAHTQAIRWLELYLRHPAGWHVLKERAARHLAYARAQTSAAVLEAERAAVGEGSPDEQASDAVRLIMEWASLSEEKQYPGPS